MYMSSLLILVPNGGKRGKKIGRFEVMAVLQAARYYVLTGDLRKSFSFGLNRAIFYAWAKHYGKGVRSYASERVRGVERREEEGKPVVYVGDEKAFLGPSGYFMMGGKEQTPSDFERNVASRIEVVAPFEKVWKAAVEYVKRFSRETLLSQQEFFEKVYKPVRDNFLEAVVEGKRSTLDSFLKRGEGS